MKNGKQKNNILHISRTMDIGGAERIVYQLATDLKDEFDQVHVASTGGLWEEKLAENGIQHHRILDVDSKQPATVLKILAPRSSKKMRLLLSTPITGWLLSMFVCCRCAIRN